MTFYYERCLHRPQTCCQLHWEPEAEGLQGDLGTLAHHLHPREILLQVRGQLLVPPAQIHLGGPRGNHPHQQDTVKVQGCWGLEGKGLQAGEEAGLGPST